jgi:hypothetical protein
MMGMTVEYHGFLNVVQNATNCILAFGANFPRRVDIENMAGNFPGVWLENFDGIRLKEPPLYIFSE